MTYCGIGHKRIEKYGDCVPKCVICAGFHKIKDHQYEIIGCNKRANKVCIYVTVQHANCGGGYFVNSSQCTLRHKIEVDVYRKKTLDKCKAKVVETNKKKNNPHNKANSNVKMGMDLRKEDWV